MPKVNFAAVPDHVDRVWLNELFEQIALAFGGLVATDPRFRGPEDDAIWSFVKALDLIRLRACKRVSDPTYAEKKGWPRPHLRPHPALVDFLAKIRS